MKYQKKISIGNYLKKGVDFKDGDLVKIMNEGKEVPGEYGMQNMFMVKAEEKEGNVSFNQTTLNGLIDAYGDDSSNWINRMVKAHAIKQNVAGKFIVVWYFSHPQAELTEDGFILPIDGPDIKPEGDDIPVIEDGKDSKSRKGKKSSEVDEIDVKDIPF